MGRVGERGELARVGLEAGRAADPAEGPFETAGRAEEEAGGAVALARAATAAQRRDAAAERAAPGRTRAIGRERARAQHLEVGAQLRASEVALGAGPSAGPDGGQPRSRRRVVLVDARARLRRQHRRTGARRETDDGTQRVEQALRVELE